MRLVFDLEADGWRDVATRVWCVAAKDIDTGIMNTFDPTCINQAIDFLSGADELIGHNIINYDLPLLERLYGFKFTGKITDTVILSRLYKSDRDRPVGTNAGTHALEAWGYRVGRGKPAHDDWTQFTPEMMHRCTEDVEINHLTYNRLMEERKLLNVDWRQAEELEHHIAAIMTQQEINGVPLDLEKVHSLAADLRSRIDAIDAEIVPQLPQVELSASRQAKWPSKQFKKDGTPTVQALKYYGEGHSTYRTDLIVKTEPINLGSEKQVKDYLLSIGWTPTEWNFKKGPNGKPIRNEYGDKIKTSPKLTLDSLESCRWPEGSELFGTKIVERMVLSHRLGLLEGWIRDVRPDGRISSEVIPMGTPTGRMTHRKVVNVPRTTSILGKELRDCFTTIPGWTRVGGDLSSCQLRGLCNYMGDEVFQHKVLYEDVHTYAQELAYLDNRDQGKKLVYLTLFGGGPPKLSTDLGVPLAKAREVQATFFTNLPKLKELLDRLSKEWKDKGGWLTGLDGRAIWVRSEHMCLVYMMQDLEAVVMKNWLVEMHKCMDLEYVQQVTVMHDEAQFLVRDEAVEDFDELAHIIMDMVNDKFQLKCKQEIELKHGKTWGDCH